MLLTAMLMIAAQATPPIGNRNSPRPVSPALRQSITRHFNTQLLDAPSARWLWPTRRGDGTVYCGWVNGRNRMGGYTGWYPYWVVLEGNRVTEGEILQTDHRAALELFGRRCIQAGYDIFEPPRQ